MSVNPNNPTIVKGLGTPAPGITRTTVDGSLEWYDSSLNGWRPAVRQHRIRDRLLQQANTQGAYRFPRGAGNGNNVTAPLAADLDDGGDWANRPDRLYQLDPTEDQYRRDPTTVMMDGNGVMLDPFDHPIRDFGNDLPIILSSEMKGWEVENYLRRNLAIKVYDLVARCPKIYTIGTKTHSEAPRFQSIRERATKFREQAGLLAWHDRDGGGAIRQYILSILPAGATTTKGLGGDLTVAQKKARKAKNAGKCPNKRRIAKRRAEATATRIQDRPANMVSVPRDNENGDDDMEDSKNEGMDESLTTTEGDVQASRCPSSNNSGQSMNCQLSSDSDSHVKPWHGDSSTDLEASLDSTFGWDTTTAESWKNSRDHRVFQANEDSAEDTTAFDWPEVKVEPAADEDQPAFEVRGQVQGSRKHGAGDDEDLDFSAPKRRRSNPEDLQDPFDVKESFVRRSKAFRKVPGGSKPIFEMPRKEFTTMENSRHPWGQMVSSSTVHPKHSDGDKADFTPYTPSKAPRPTSNSRIETNNSGNPTSVLDEQDVRYWIPAGRYIYTVRRALNLTIMDFAVRLDLSYTDDLFPTYRMSYIDQTSMLQKLFEREWQSSDRLGPAPRLFVLGRWGGSFSNWSIGEEDGWGQGLERRLDEWAIRNRRGEGVDE